MVRAVAVVYVAVTVTEDPPCLLPPAFKFPTSLSTPPHPSESGSAPTTQRELHSTALLLETCPPASPLARPNRETARAPRTSPGTFIPPSPHPPSNELIPRRSFLSFVAPLSLSQPRSLPHVHALPHTDAFSPHDTQTRSLTHMHTHTFAPLSHTKPFTRAHSHKPARPHWHPHPLSVIHRPALSHPLTCSLIDIHSPSLIHSLSLIPALCHMHPPLCHTHLLWWHWRLHNVLPYEAQVGQGCLPLSSRPNWLGGGCRRRRGGCALSADRGARTATGASRRDSVAPVLAVGGCRVQAPPAVSWGALLRRSKISSNSS